MKISFIKVQLTYHVIHPFEVYISRSFENIHIQATIVTIKIKNIESEGVRLPLSWPWQPLTLCLS